MVRYAPQLLNAQFAAQRPNLFPVTPPDRRAAADRIDYIATLVDMAADPALVPGELSIRNLGGFGAQGEGKYMMNKYLRERGDANIRSNADLVGKATFYQDPNFPDRRQMRENTERQLALDTAVRLQGRFAVQTIVLQCMQEQRLDALVAADRLGSLRRS